MTIVQPIIDCTEHVEVVVSVIPVQLFYKVGIFRLVVTGAHIEAEALTLCRLCAYLNYSLNTCIIFGARVGDEFYALDVL